MLESLANFLDEVTKGGRVQDLAQLARENEFTFVKRESFGMQSTATKAFAIFAQKGLKRFLGIIEQPLEAVKGTMRFFDYLRNKDLDTKTTSIIEIQCSDIEVDYFMISPKNVFSKMKGFFVSQQKQFADLEDFYQNFQVSTRHPEAAFLLKKSALHLVTEFPGITIEANGNQFLFYFNKKEVKINKILPLMDFAEEFIRLLSFDSSDDYV